MPKTVRTTRGTLGGKRTPELLAMPRKRSAFEVLALNLCRLVERLIIWLARHPLVALTLAAFVASIVYVGQAGTGYLVLSLAVVTACWWWRFPASFGRLAAGPARAQWRLLSCYRRHWQPAMAMTGLASMYGDTEYLPRIRKIHSNKYADRVLVELLAGQSPADVEKVTDALAHTFGARRCAVRVDRPRRVWLDFFHADALLDPIPALPVPETPDFLALPLGRHETGLPWVLRLLGTHVLIAGATGAGKGSVLWSIARSLGNGVRTGTVRLWGIDPKGGMELSFGRRLFDRLAYDSTESMLDLLDATVAFMRERQRRLLGLTRSHEPSQDDPLLVLVVDELAALIAYVDRETRKRASDALQLLLSQGRAVGVLVVAAVQDPSKEIIAFRDLFPARIALRLIEAPQVEMVLGKGARDRGAECDRIPASLPGTGYVVLEGVREPARVRAAYVSDLDLADLQQHYTPGAPDPIQLADDGTTPARFPRLRWLLGRPETA